MDEFIWIPDWDAQGNTTPDVSKIQFGDGYVQRQTKGMNPLKVIWSLSFKNRTDSEADALEAFLKARYGVIAFTWTAPGGVQSKWISQPYSRSKAANDVNNISVSLELVYEP